MILVGELSLWIALLMCAWSVTLSFAGGVTRRPPRHTTGEAEGDGPGAHQQRDPQRQLADEDHRDAVSVGAALVPRYCSCTLAVSYPSGAAS